MEIMDVSPPVVKKPQEISRTVSAKPFLQNEVKIEADKNRIEEVSPAVKVYQPEQSVKVVSTETNSDVSSDDRIEVVRQKWKDVLEKMKVFSPMGYGCLTEAGGLEFVSAGKLKLAFKKGYSFHKSRIEDSTNRQALEGFIQEVTGFSVSITCVIEEGEAKLENSVKAKPSVNTVAVLSQPKPVTVKVASEINTQEGEKAKVSMDDLLEMFDGTVVS